MKKSKEKMEMKPNPNCNYCSGRGWVSFVHPTNQNMRELRPCECVKVIVPKEDVSGKYDKDAESYLVKL